MTGATPMLPDPTATAEVSRAQVAEWIDLPDGERPRLIDCREAEELAVCQLPGNEWIPLGTFPEKAAAIAADAQRGIVVYCHHGMRSMRAAQFLRAHGVARAFSMAGGIDAWSRLVDPKVPRY